MFQLKELLDAVEKRERLPLAASQARAEIERLFADVFAAAQPVQEDSQPVEDKKPE